MWWHWSGPWGCWMWKSQGKLCNILISCHRSDRTIAHKPHAWKVKKPSSVARTAASMCVWVVFAPVFLCLSVVQPASFFGCTPAFRKGKKGHKSPSLRVWACAHVVLAFSMRYEMPLVPDSQNGWKSLFMIPSTCHRALSVPGPSAATARNGNRATRPRSLLDGYLVNNCTKYSAGLCACAWMGDPEIKVFCTLITLRAWIRLDFQFKFEKTPEWHCAKFTFFNVALDCITQCLKREICSSKYVFCHFTVLSDFI